MTQSGRLDPVVIAAGHRDPGRAGDERVRLVHAYAVAAAVGVNLAIVIPLVFGTAWAADRSPSVDRFAVVLGYSLAGFVLAIAAGLGAAVVVVLSDRRYHDRWSRIYGCALGAGGGMLALSIIGSVVTGQLLLSQSIPFGIAAAIVAFVLAWAAELLARR